MPKYRFKVSGYVEVEAPNVLQAIRYVNKGIERSKELKDWETVRISAGSGSNCRPPKGRNIDYSQYWVSVRYIPNTKRIELCNGNKPN